jgi:hypothetical protein
MPMSTRHTEPTSALTSMQYGRSGLDCDRLNQTETVPFWVPALACEPQPTTGTVVVYTAADVNRFAGPIDGEFPACGDRRIS